MRTAAETASTPARLAVSVRVAFLIGVSDTRTSPPPAGAANVLANLVSAPSLDAALNVTVVAGSRSAAP